MSPADDSGRYPAFPFWGSVFTDKLTTSNQTKFMAAYFHVKSQQNHMATTFSFTVSVTQDRAHFARWLLEECHRLVGELELELTEYQVQSPVYQFNHAAAGTTVELPPSTAELLDRSLWLETVTEKSFSPVAKSHFNSEALHWSPQERRLFRDKQATWLGFGAIGKGFALDKVRERLVFEGIENFFLWAGGSSLILSGFADPKDSTPWTWAWSWKKNEKGEAFGVPFSHSSGRPIAIGVSGTQEKGDHIQRSSTEEKRPYQTALVACSSATDADALSTALFNDGLEKLLPKTDKLPSPIAAATIDENDVPRWNHYFQQLWGALTMAIFWLSTFSFADEEAIDLGEDALSSFAPYSVDRNPFWILLPTAALILVLIHLKDSRPKSRIATPPEDPK